MTATRRTLTPAHAFLRIVLTLVRCLFLLIGLVLWFQDGFVQAAPFMWVHLIMAIEAVHFRISLLEDKSI